MNNTSFKNFEKIVVVKNAIIEGISSRKEFLMHDMKLSENQYSNSFTGRGDGVLSQLITLDLDCPFEVLRWIQDYQMYSEHESVFVPNREILALFETHRLLPRMFTWVSFQDLSKMEQAKWLIGQALDGIEESGKISAALPIQIKSFLRTLLGKLSDI